MYGLDYNHLSQIQDTKGREAAYAEQLKIDYYRKEINNIVETNTLKVIRSSEHSGLLIKDSIDDFNSSMTTHLNSLSCSISDFGDTLIDINQELSSINSELNNISGILDWGFNAVIENQRLSLLILTNLSELAKIPDEEKKRIFLIKRGIERQQEAFYHPPLYKKAIQHYLAALDLFDDDPFVLNRLGFIHLYSKEDIDFNKAAKYFEDAVNYIVPKYNSRRNLNDNDIYDSSSGLLAPQLFRDLRHQTSLSLFYAAQANILLNNTLKGIGYLNEALIISKEFHEAKYLLIKALCLENDYGTIKKLISELLDQSPLYYFKFKKEYFFQHHSIVINYVDQYYQELLSNVSVKINALSSIISQNSILRKHYNYILSAYVNGK